MNLEDESGNKIKGDWLATVILRSKKRFGKTANESRENFFDNLLGEIKGRTLGPGIILLPGGCFNSGVEKASVILSYVAGHIKERIREANRNIIVCFGIDGMMGRGYPKDFPKDQLAIAVSKKGIVAIGRKFHPTQVEKDRINSADTYQSLEGGYPRIFSFNGRHFFLAVCYDIFGIRQKSLHNPGVDVVLNTIHQFTPRCDCEGDICKCGAASGDVYFARNGLAGASKQWNCPVFGSVVFFNRDIPEKWPSGVYWKSGSMSTQKWKYKDNSIKPKNIFEVKFEEGVASVRMYNLNW